VQVFVKQSFPHNGCPQRIKKRKKNKGRNKWRKRGLLQDSPRKKALPKASGLSKKISDSFDANVASNTSKRLRKKWEHTIAGMSSEHLTPIHSLRRLLKTRWNPQKKLEQHKANAKLKSWKHKRRL